ncbi:MAG: hypothetical protein AAGI71_18205 [Bacteroidota bacterium]
MYTPPTSSTSASPVEPPNPRPSTMEEAAEQFEAILVNQLVKTMTKGLFDQSLAGAGGVPGLGGQQDLQRDTLAQVLTDHLMKQGGLGIAERLSAQWQRTQDADV